MSSTKFAEIKSQITSALAAKNVTGRCPMCGNLQWTLAEGFVYVSMQPDFQGMYVGSGGLPSVALVCTRCGNTQIMNLVALGLGHLLGMPVMPAGASLK